VIPWLFALLPGQPGWFGPVQGPQFLAAALTSALAGVTVLAYVFRRAFGWAGVIDDRVFDQLSRWMGLFALLFLWLQLQQVLTGVTMGPEPVSTAVAGKLAHPLYWVALALLAVTLAHAGAQVIAPRLFSVPRTVAVAVLPLVAVYIEKTLFVVEGLMYPAFDLYAGVPGSYTPSWVELSSLAGAFGIVVLFFVVASKAIPLIELQAVKSRD
jgi:Ni/Fe-hydrogenase subunit HybB-like protein